MNKFIKKIFGSFGYMIVRSKTLASPDGWETITGGIFRNSAAERVDNKQAMTVSTLFACIRNVSEDVGKLPLKVYRKDGEYRHEMPQHPVGRMLQYQPNPEMTAIAFRETMNAQAMGWGNAFAEIQRNINGDPIAIWPLRPDRVKLFKEKGTGRVFYKVTSNNGRTSDIWGDDILHLHGLGFDGLVGYNIVHCASQSVGAAIAMDKFAGSYFANGMHQSGNLKHPGNLSEPAQKRLKAQLAAEYGGADKAHQTLVMEEGMEFQANVIDPKASQMIETRRFSVTDFCRWMRVPPHKVADLTKSSFSNMEEQNIDYVQDGLGGWIKRWEQVLWSKLLSGKEKRDGVYFEHSVAAMLRGNVKARGEYYKTMWDRGVYSINEIRSFENKNPIDGGDTHFVPVNFTSLENAGKATPGNAVVKDIAARLANREIKTLESRVKHAADDMGRFKEWLNEFYEKHDAYIFDATRSLCEENKASVCIDLLSLRPFLQMAADPAEVLADRRDKHADYIANNLRSYYEN